MKLYNIEISIEFYEALSENVLWESFSVGVSTVSSHFNLRTEMRRNQASKHQQMTESKSELIWSVGECGGLVSSGGNLYLEVHSETFIKRLSEIMRFIGVRFNSQRWRVSYSEHPHLLNYLEVMASDLLVDEPDAGDTRTRFSTRSPDRAYNHVLTVNEVQLLAVLSETRLNPEFMALKTSSLGSTSMSDFEEWEGFFPEEFLNYIADYIKSRDEAVGMLRGDTISFTFFAYRNTNIFFWNGDILIPCETEFDEYGHVPREFKLKSNFKYWSDIVTHNRYIWLDLSTEILDQVVDPEAEKLVAEWVDPGTYSTYLCTCLGNDFTYLDNGDTNFEFQPVVWLTDDIVASNLD